MKVIRFLLIQIILIQILICFGCISGKSVDYYIIKKNETGLQDEDKVVILAKTTTSFESAKIEESASKCLLKGFLKKDIELKLFPSADFRQIALTNSDANCENYNIICQIHALLENPILLDKMQRLGVRYIIIIEQKKVDKGLSADGLAEMGGANVGGAPSVLFVGSVSNEELFQYNCSIFDLTHKDAESGIVGLNAWGGKGVAWYVAIPVFYSEDAASNVCKAFGDKVAEFLIEPSIGWDFSGTYEP